MNKYKVIIWDYDTNERVEREYTADSEADVYDFASMELGNGQSIVQIRRRDESQNDLERLGDLHRGRRLWPLA